ncbi:hypothetical protein RX327_24235 [Bradyrhizobium sp. BEA-2-5]|uniref:hypothetical protein n=1 Tax=Bradyrhizobium sp. BEA-2-5 TaxID=3080015 RepID=UPI00293F1E3F|nr:hypothetical protein [Bradyrhizobium sp. BEA-2-5]WOH79013.1 hypothetical protein RX327_24235 [Bradyrhizobium sp. BEA-2-5]
MISEAMAGASALKTAFDMAKALKDINNAATRNAAVIELQEKILSAQQAQFEMSKRVDELEKQLAVIKSKADERNRYQLKDYGAGTFAYELKPAESRGEPLHRACAKCFNEGQINILQFSHRTEGQDWFDCRRCDNNQAFGVRVRRERDYSHQSDF